MLKGVAIVCTMVALENIEVELQGSITNERRAELTSLNYELVQTLGNLLGSLSHFDLQVTNAVLVDETNLLNEERGKPQRHAHTSYFEELAAGQEAN